MRSIRKLVLVALFIAIAAVSASAQSTEFTFQGNLQNGGSAANGNHDFEFLLYTLFRAERNSEAR